MKKSTVEPQSAEVEELPAKRKRSRPPKPVEPESQLVIETPVVDAQAEEIPEKRKPDRPPKPVKGALKSD